MENGKKMYVTAEEAAEMLGVSTGYAYKIIRGLNEELKAKGYRTISGMMEKDSVNHNTRAFTAKNVDKERSRDNVEFCHSDIKEVYHTLFDEALERYNAKQKRSNRKIDNYYEKICRGK